MKPRPIHLLLITTDKETPGFISTLLTAGNVEHSQKIVLELLSVESFSRVAEAFATPPVAGQPPRHVVLAEYAGIVVPDEIRILRQAIADLPLLILGDQEENLEDPSLLDAWRHAGADDYLLRAQLTSHWLRHSILRYTRHLSRHDSSSASSPDPVATEPLPSADYAEQHWQLLDKLFANVPILICAFTGPEHVYRYANSLYLQTVGNRDVVGKPIRQALPELEGQGVYELLDEVYATDVAHRGQELQVWLKNEEDGELEEFYFAVIFAPVAIPVIVPSENHLGKLEVTSEKMIFVVALNISERVNIRRQLQEAHAQLNALFASVPLGLAFVDRELRFLRVNPALAAMNGLPAELHLGQTPDTLLPDLHAIHSIMDQWRQIIATGNPVIGVEVSGRTPAHPDQDQIWEESWFPVTLNHEVLGLGIVAENITHRKLAEVEREQLLTVLADERVQLDHLNRTLERRVQERSQQVRTLASELTLAEQRERHRIAQILHDHIQQLLYGIDFRIALLAGSATTEQQTLLDEFREIVQEAIHATRTLAVDLSPPVLQGDGLVQALQWLAHQMEVIHSLQVTLDVQEPFQPPTIELRVLLLQSVRELLFNVVKHAHTSLSTVYLRQEAGHLIVQVVDNGRGFDATTHGSAPRQPESFGLYSIHERMQLFGGRLEIISTPGGGTRAVLTLPIAS